MMESGIRLSERENKFIQLIYDHTGGDVSQMILNQDLYLLAERNGFYHPEVTSIVKMLSGGLLVEKRSYKGVIDNKPVGQMIGCVRLTARGASYVRTLSDPTFQDPEQADREVSRKTLSWTQKGVIVGITMIIVVLFGYALQYFNVI